MLGKKAQDILDNTCVELQEEYEAYKKEWDEIAEEEEASSCFYEQDVFASWVISVLARQRCQLGLLLGDLMQREKTK